VSTPFNHHDLKILVVDDDPVIRDMMVDIFELEEYPIYVARNGREALEKLRQDGHFLVFLDLMMPVLDGRAVCLQLQAEPQVRQRHIVILMSAIDNLAEASTLNVDGTMPKPFSVDDVFRIIRPYLPK
jgi:CheY-like chemotaxis protein